MPAKRRKNIGTNNIFHRNAGAVLFIVAALICALIAVSLAACDKDVPPAEDAPPAVDAPSEDETPSEGETPPEGGEEDAPKLKKFENVVYEDTFVTYDGRAHVIEAQGLPFGTTVKYSLTDCVDVGEYDITATFKLVGYETLSLTATLTILPAKADVAFEDAYFEWDGWPHSIYVVGDLPSDAVVEYDGNGCVDVGEHTVTAHITLNKNYLPVDDLSAKLIITERQYVVSFVHWDGEVETIKVYRGGSVQSEDIPVTKHRDGFYEMVWDPADLLQLLDVRSDVTVYEIAGEAITYTVVFIPNGGTMQAMPDLQKTEDGKWMLRYTVLDNIYLPEPYMSPSKGVFAGWFDQEGRLVTHIPDKAGLRDMVLTAKWDKPGAATLSDNCGSAMQNTPLPACVCRPKPQNFCDFCHETLDCAGKIQFKM